MESVLVGIDLDDFQDEIVNAPGPSSTPLPPVVWVHSGQRIQLPWRYDDFLPGEPTGLRQALLPSSNIPAFAGPSSSRPPQTLYQTEPDSSNLFCVYLTYPTLIPDLATGLLAVTDALNLEQQPHLSSTQVGSLTPPATVT
ncbi:hypothetical protein BS17DRAFT_883161 [Gyrodon lividus]|nr:hypothetical protein BS17DRAFT_883161 [Gyrodon lividus]